MSDYRRGFPQGVLASTLIGRVGSDGKGLSGAERTFNQKLTAKSQKLALRRDAKGRLVRASLRGAESEAESEIRNEGDSLHLSLDSVIQSELEKELATAKESSGALRAMGVMMDADSGEIIAMAQTESYDAEKSRAVNPAMLRNRVLQDTFEPGSTLKPLVTALALEEKRLARGEKLDCEDGKIKVGKHTIRDVHPESVLSVKDVLVRSSNVCMVKIGLRMQDKLRTGLSELGFGSKTGLELGGEAAGIFRKDWREIDVATASFGHGLSVSALQLVRAYAALANGGRLVKPSILKDQLGESTRVLSPEVAKNISQMLRGVTEDEEGTGKNAKVAGLSVYGKTGTAEKTRIGGRGYDSDRVLASFVGYVDANELGVDRKLVLYIGVDEPSVYPRWGGTLAAPVFSKVMEKTVSYLLRTEPGRIVTAKKTLKANLSRHS